MVSWNPPNHCVLVPVDEKHKETMRLHNDDHFIVRCNVLHVHIGEGASRLLVPLDMYKLIIAHVNKLDRYTATLP